MKAKLINAATNLLYARRSGNVKREQAQYAKLRSLCEEANVDMADILHQVTEHLKKTSIAARMNGIV
jgi:hypothetical protein